MIQWIQTSRLSIKNSLSRVSGDTCRALRRQRAIRPPGEGVGSSVQGVGVRGAGFRPQGVVFRVSDFGLDIFGLGFQVSGRRFSVSG